MEYTERCLNGFNVHEGYLRLRLRRRGPVAELHMPTALDHDEPFIQIGVNIKVILTPPRIFCIEKD